MTSEVVQNWLAVGMLVVAALTLGANIYFARKHSTGIEKQRQGIEAYQARIERVEKMETSLENGIRELERNVANTDKATTWLYGYLEGKRIIGNGKRR